MLKKENPHFSDLLMDKQMCAWIFLTRAKSTKNSKLKVTLEGRKVKNEIDHYDFFDFDFYNTYVRYVAKPRFH